MSSGSVNLSATLYVYSGGTTHDVLIVDGTQYLYQGATAVSDRVSGSGSVPGQIIVSGGAVLSSTADAGGNILLSNGGTADATTLNNQGYLAADSGTSATSTTVNSGGYFQISGGKTSATTINSGGYTVVTNSGQAQATSVSNGGRLQVQSAGVATSTTVTGSGSVLVYSAGLASATTLQGTSAGMGLTSGGTAIDTVVGSGAFVAAISGTLAGTTTIDQGGTVYGYSSGPSLLTLSGTVNDAGTLVSGTLASGATLTVSSGGEAADLWVTSGGTASIESGATLVSDIYVSSGGVLALSSGVVMSGATVHLAQNGQATLAADAGGTVILDGSANTGLTISGLSSGGVLTTVISGFDGTAAGNSDGIEISGLTAADVTSVSYAPTDSDHVTLSLTNGNSITLTIAGVKNHGFTLETAPDGSLVYEVCFLTDTMIRTPVGDVAVQDLHVGDDVITCTREGTPAVRKLIWTGKAHATVRVGLPADEAGYPVRVLKDAIAEGVPYKDLLITSEHCLFFDGMFIPVRMLVNGRSVFYDTSLTSYEYYHIETEEQSVILADGMMTESYLDTGNRYAFRRSGKIASVRPPVKSWEADAAYPLTVARDRVEPVYRTLSERAANVASDTLRTPKILSKDPNFHLITEKDQIIRQARSTGNTVTFMLPASVDTVRLVSRTSRPSDIIGPFLDDRRALGVLVGKVSLFEGDTTRSITAHLETPDLHGWHAQESTLSRWTNGHAVLPLGKRASRGFGMLSLEILAAGPYAVPDKSYQ
ncbi:Hint domain-containing protein [Acetobacter farinalis]|uniref:Hint domain-containing protein n=1 Tax=Acetobacter farinalis TaxID=1260984 RepID=A0ABT3Q9H3_9PROT|nr:Hint domain-containing protein [Acetobacter farinalis]MCX2561915.1 Hint domain-containing protein [Acetobacter farinalis]